MKHRQYDRSLLPAAASVIAGWFVIAAVHPEGPMGPLNALMVGLLLGMVFGQVTLAAAWTARGPLPPWQRLPLALAWLAAINVALAINLFQGPGGPFPLVIAVCLLAQWVLVQAPLWGLAWWYGLAIEHAAAMEQALPVRRQFGIRQLMVLTAIVAILLALGRLIYPWLAWSLGGDWDEQLLFGFLTAAGIVMSLPLVLAALLPQRAVVAVILVGVVERRGNCVGDAPGLAGRPSRRVAPGRALRGHLLVPGGLGCGDHRPGPQGRIRPAPPLAARR